MKKWNIFEELENVQRQRNYRKRTRGYV